VIGAVGLRLRTAAVLGLMRAADYDSLRAAHERGWLAPLEVLVRRGAVRILFGPSRKLRLSGAHFPYWSAQAYGVLTGQHELMVQEAMRRTLGVGAVMIDVGSNIGAIALLGARLVGPEGRVIAIDPQRECAAATAINARINGFENVTAVHAAAAAHTGEAEVIVAADSLWTRLATVGEHPLERRRDTVRAVALDDLISELGVSRVDLVKIDVEGAELDVIAGMRTLLGELRPVVVCEMHGKNAAFCDAIRELGYRVTNLDGPEPVEHAGGNVHAWCEPWPAGPAQ
jgi:FkbM family methyltransferase